MDQRDHGAKGQDGANRGVYIHPQPLCFLSRANKANKAQHRPVSNLWLADTYNTFTYIAAYKRDVDDNRYRTYIALYSTPANS